jgi:hypothetical protein
MTERELMIVGQLGSYSKPNLYKFLRKYMRNATDAMEMAKMLDLWHRSCIEIVDKAAAGPSQASPVTKEDSNELPD